MFSNSSLIIIIIFWLKICFCKTLKNKKNNKKWNAQFALINTTTLSASRTWSIRAVIVFALNASPSCPRNCVRTIEAKSRVKRLIVPFSNSSKWVTGVVKQAAITIITIIIKRAHPRPKNKIPLVANQINPLESKHFSSSSLFYFWITVWDGYRREMWSII